MKKIIPHLWYDKEAKEAALLYISLFENSRLVHTSIMENTPSGDAEVVSFELAGQPFMAISAGPYFKLNPTVSLMVACLSKEEVNQKWEALSAGGTVFMELGEYPFSKWYGWVQDKYGLSWQLMLVEEAPPQKITPNLLFSKDVCGKAEEAIQYYTSIFENSGVKLISKYGPGEAPNPKAQVNYAAFTLAGVDFSAMDNAMDVDFSFNEAFSLMVNCSDQEEIDYYWEKLSAAPEAEQCGWVKDAYGLSWQVVPEILDEMMAKATREEMARIVAAIMPMKKFDIEAIKQATLGNSSGK